MVKADFNIDNDTWIIFKAMTSKLKVTDKDGRKRQATASDVLRELIFEWITDNSELLNDVLKHLQKIGSQVKIEEWKSEQK
jgi:hypothetical protein